ncbi:MAG TPA: C40 family peptidase [Gemmatimonadales bacterium]|nr:C40 family peptidase [Gemmatimonadales bacterium]
MSHDISVREYRRSAFLAAVALGFTSFTSPAVAQSSSQPWVFTAFAARKEDSSSPVFGGISFAKFGGILGMRLGGAIHFNNGTPDNSVTPVVNCGRYGCNHMSDPWSLNVGAWSANADLVLEPFRTVPALKALLLGFSPYGFAGIGGYGVRVNGGADSSVATVSYGVGARHELFGALGLQAEARYRRPLDNSVAYAPGLRENLEYTLGMTVSWGAHSHHESAPKSLPPPPMAPRSLPPSPPPPVSDEMAAHFAARIIELAESYVNVPYRTGGSTPYGGFDAAGFVQYVFAREGVRLPRTLMEMAQRGEAVSLRMGSAQPGDLLFFASDGSNIDHVAIYAGHERIIHSTATGGGVRYDGLSDGERGRWFAEHLVAARRIVGTTRYLPPVDAQPDETLEPPDASPRVPK